MKIVFQGKTKTGKNVLIRYPELSDVEAMLSYINKISDEQTFIRYQGEHETLESETKYLNSVLENIKNKKAVHLLVFSENSLIGTSSIHMLDKTEKHVGIFGITIAKDFRNEGVGRLLMEKLFEEAKKEMPQLKIVTLRVYSKNSIAKRIYEKFGFAQYGLLPRGITRKGEYEDEISMYKNI